MGVREFISTVVSKRNRELVYERRNLERQHGSQIRELRAQNKILVQASNDITINEDSSSTNTHYTGNKYNSYPKQVAQMDLMYRGLATWGNMITKNVIDVRAAFSTGQGLQVVKREGYTKPADRELTFIREFMQYNNLDKEIPQEYAKEAEIEGQTLFKFKPAKTTGGDSTIRLLFVPWRKCKYGITFDVNDFYTPIRAKYTGSVGEYPSFDLTADEFVYRRFGGSPFSTDTPTKMAFCIGYAENLDKAIWDWREINRIHSSPTPVITLQDKEAAKEAAAYLTQKNWKIGKLLVLFNGKFELVGWHGEGYTTLQEEMMAMVKTISGTTGIPVHFFGYPELLSNRDTADNLIELIVLATNKERKTWISAYEEIFRKAILAYNKEYNNNLDPNAIDAKMPFATSAKLKEIAEVWLPMYQGNTISLHTLLAQLSGDIDVEEEVKRIEEDLKKKDERAAENAKRTAKLSEGDGSGDGSSGNRQLRGSGRAQ